MHVVSLIAQKGGVGKTTLGVSLAALFAHVLSVSRSTGRARPSHVGIIDTDPSGNASAWLRLRTTPPLGVHAPSARLFGEALAAAKEERFTHVFVDTAAGVDPLNMDVARASRVVLIPVMPTASSLRGIAPTVDMVTRTKTPAAFVLNGVGTGHVTREACVRSLQDLYGLPVAPSAITFRRVFGALEDTGGTLGELDSPNLSAQNGQEELFRLARWLRFTLDAPASSLRTLLKKASSHA